MTGRMLVAHASEHDAASDIAGAIADEPAGIAREVRPPAGART